MDNNAFECKEIYLLGYFPAVESAKYLRINTNGDDKNNGITFNILRTTNTYFYIHLGLLGTVLRVFGVSFGNNEFSVFQDLSPYGNFINGYEISEDVISSINLMVSDGSANILTDAKLKLYVK